MPKSTFATIVAVLGLAACSSGSGGGDTNDPPTAGGGGSGTGSGGTPTPPTDPSPNPPSTTEPPLVTLTCSPCKKIVFVSAADGDGEIYSIGVDGTGLLRLTENGVEDADPAWSPDGTRIAFTRGSVGQPRDLYLMDADGNNVRRLTVGKSVAHPAWSTDGLRIVHGDGDVFEVSVPDGSSRLLVSTPGFEMEPALAPDVARLALASDWFAYDFVFDIFLANADGSGFTALTDGNVFDRLNYVEPAWSPDGSQLAVIITSEDSRTHAISRALGLLNTSGGALSMLPVPTAAGPGSPSWSPDGSMIAYSACDGSNCRVSWIRADGSARGEIVADGFDPDWQR